MPRLSFSHPFNGGFQPLSPRLLAFGFGDPFHIFLFVAVAEALERCQRLLVLLQRSQQVIRNREFLFHFGPRRRGRLDSSRVQFRRFPDVTEQHFVRRQVGEFCDATELSVRGIFRFTIAEDQLPVPEPEGAMLFESGRAAENSVVHEMGKTPLHRFLHLGTTGVNQPAQVIQDGSGKIRRPGDVGIDALIFPGHKEGYRLQVTGYKFSVRRISTVIKPLFYSRNKEATVNKHHDQRPENL